MRRTIILLVALALFCLGTTLPAAADPSPEGALRASFQASWTGGEGTWYATFAHGGAGFVHAANGAIYTQLGGVDAGARRVSPVWPEQEYCSDHVLGIWAIMFAAESEKELVEEFTGDIWLDDELLPSTSSAVKRIVDPARVYFGGQRAWARSVGVPVYGTLDPGTYHLYSEWNVGGQLVVFDSYVSIVDCSD